MKTEFAFTPQDLLDLIGRNVDAKNIIFKFEKVKDKEKLTARAQETDGGGEYQIEGCPYPPGCT